MKKIITLLVAAIFAVGAGLVEAAPKKDGSGKTAPEAKKPHDKKPMAKAGGKGG